MDLHFRLRAVRAIALSQWEISYRKNGNILLPETTNEKNIASAAILEYSGFLYTI
jgi:hypothetical protein